MSGLAARPNMRRRDLDHERVLTRHACAGYMDAEALIVHAENRALRLCGEYVPDPMYVRLDRDRPLDVREELADARNHLVWWLQDHPDDTTVPEKIEALRYICAAYTKL